MAELERKVKDTSHVGSQRHKGLAWRLGARHKEASPKQKKLQHTDTHTHKRYRN